MKICPLCGNAMQDTEQFCTSCGNPHETREENQQVSQPTQPVLTTEPVLETTAPIAPAAPLQPQPVQGAPAPDVTAPPVIAAPPQPKPQTPPQAQQIPPAPGPAAGSNQPPEQSAMYGTQTAYEQTQSMYGQPGCAQQSTYAPYVQGTVPPPPPPPVQASSMYQPAPMQGYYQDETVSLGEWMLNYLIMVIPIVNIIMLCIWGFGDSAKKSVRNWARASLIWMGIGIVFLIVFFLFIGVMVANMLSYGYYGY